MSRRLALFLTNPMVENHELPANADIGATVAALDELQPDELQPDGLFGYSTALTMVACEARADVCASHPRWSARAASR